MQVTKLVLGPANNNVYIVVCPRTSQSLIIDASYDATRITAAAAGTSVQAILLTHGDRDHVDALQELRALLNVPVGVHEADVAMLPEPPNFLIEDGSEMTAGDMVLRAIHTPGHTPGSLCFLGGNTLLSGDTLFPGGPGATRGDPARFDQIITGIRERLLVLPDDTLVRPGHGDDTTIGHERPSLPEWIARGW